jgi:hypothetical protein
MPWIGDETSSGSQRSVLSTSSPFAQPRICKFNFENSLGVLGCVSNPPKIISSAPSPSKSITKGS